MDFVLHLIRGLLGIAVIIGICYAFSNNKKAINWRLTAIGLAMMIIFCFLVNQTIVYYIFQGIGSMFARLQEYTTEGAKFVLGNLAISPGVEGSIGFIFAFQVLPTILFISALMSMFYYLGWMQKVVRGIGWVMEKALKVSGAESLVAASNIFVGQTEAPLFIRPYIANLTKSEMLSVMTAGMATLASGVLAAYVTMLGGGDDARTKMFGAHLLAGCIMGAIGSLVLSKILFPETEEPETGLNFKPELEKNASNVVEAVAIGASDGLKLAANVGAMLLAFIALIAMLNAILGWVGNPYLPNGTPLYDLNAWVKQVSGSQFSALSIQSVMGFVFAPFAWLMGVDSKDLLQFGRLLGEKVTLNEYVAYISLTDLQKTMSERSVIMATYALCGFANFSSIAIQIGGIGSLAPERRGEIAALGMKAVLGGMLSTALGAVIAGMLV